MAGIAVMAAGCAAERPRTGLGPHPPVVTRTDPATAAICPYGGAIVRSGLDENGNHALDDDEILASTVTCNTEPDPPAPVVLVRLDPEPAGAHCADGGTAIRSGLDRNRDGVLDDREVTEIDYVCGETLLTRLAAEPAGLHCAAGGIAFLTGRDRDGDAVLEDGEVEHTEYECGDQVARSVTIASRGELAALSHLRAIGGSLVILDPGPVSDPAFEEIALPALEQVGGGVRISAIKFLARIALPRLAQVGAATEIVDNSLLTQVAWAQLAHVGGALAISRNPQLTEFDPTQLAQIGGAIEITDNVALPVIALPALPAAGDIHIARNATLGRIGLAALTQAATIAIDDNPWLPSCAVAAVFAHIEASSLEQMGNDDAAMCRR